MKTLKTILYKRIQILAILSVIALLVSQILGRVWWFAELFSHFVAWYTLIFILAAILATSWRKRAIWAICAMGLGVWLAMPFQAALNTAPTHKLLWYNVNLDNPNPDAETQTILAQSPDVVALAEIDTADIRWKSLQQHYPHGCTHAEDSPFALVVWARKPLADCQIHLIDDIAWIRAQLPDKTIIYAIHPPPPITQALAATRQKYLTEIATKIAQETVPVIVVGDFNATPFSPLFRDFMDESQTATAMRHFGPTWKIFGLPIDHVLTRQTLAQTHLLSWGNSDHRAILVSW